MLTPNQEQFCKNLEIKRMTQRAAYIDAYPNSASWSPGTVDVKASNLANSDKILVRRKELRDEQTADIKAEAKWTRDDAFRELKWMLDKAKEETEKNEGFTGPCVSAITNAIKELNTIYAVMEKADGRGVLEDILDAVRGVGND